MQPDSDSVLSYFRSLQQGIVDRLTDLDGHTFLHDSWQRAQGGGGLTCVLEEGRIFERAGVNFSHVRGDALPVPATRRRPRLTGRPFEAMGVSLVLHPRSPMCPTVHMNVRFFISHPAPEAPAGTTATWWFGGGMDLTPYYPFEEDVRHFHSVCRTAVQPYGQDLYPRFKDWCDRYFRLEHRNEARGVGGLFYDDFDELGFENCFHMTQSVGDHFLTAYLPIIEKRHNLPWGERERNFQAYRRGRYVEFNLVQDRGTLFGLQSGGRTESILMSLPPLVRWCYDWTPEPGSKEESLYTEFLPVRDWLST